VVFACAIALALGALVAAQLLESRSAIWIRARAANTNLLFTVSHLLDRALSAADRAVRHSINETERSAIRTSGLFAEEEFLVQLAQALQQAHQSGGLFTTVTDSGYGIQLILDHQGVVIASSRPPANGRLNFSDRDYFNVHASGQFEGLYIGAPFASPYDGQLSVPLSRAWRRADGSFGGVVMQTLKLSALHGLLSSIELGPDSGINVLLPDGSIMTRFPYGTDHSGVSLAGTTNFERFMREGQGTFTGIAAIDSVERLYVFRTLDRFPVVVNVAQARHAVLSTWRHDALMLGVATLVLMLACVFLAVHAARSLRAHQLAATRLQEAKRELRLVVDSLPVLVGYWNKQLLNRMANSAHDEWFGLVPDEMHGRHVREVLGDTHFDSVRPYIEKVLEGEPQTFENEFIDVRGIQRHTLSTLIPDESEGNVRGFFVLVTDISQRKRAELALWAEKERFKVILESIKDGVITTDADGRVLYLNPAAVHMTGWRVDEARGRPLRKVLSLLNRSGSEVTPCPVQHVFSTRTASPSKTELVLLSRGGRRMPIEYWVAPILDDKNEPVAAVIAFHAVGQVRAMANRMIHLAQHDALTGLPNRRLLDEEGEVALTAAREYRRRMAILYIDLDGFKLVNDEHGQAVGDALLVALPRRIKGCL